MTSLNNIDSNASSSPSVAGVGGSSRHIASGKFDGVGGSTLTLTRGFGAPIVTTTSLDNGNSSDDNYMENGDIITSSNQNNGYDDDPDSKPSSPLSQENNNSFCSNRKAIPYSLLAQCV